MADLWTLCDLRTPWCIFVVASLRVAERIEAGASGIGELAGAVNGDAYALGRVMDHLVDAGVFEEPAPGRFALNEISRGLLDPAQRLGLDLAGIGGRMAYVWGTMPTWVRTGASGYHEVFGLPFWDDLEAHPEVAASFDELIGPAGHGTPSAEFELAGGWQAVRTVVDVGGGTGAMLAEILRARPWVRGTLVDRPHAAARADETFRAAGVSERANTVGQSFFDPLPAGADLYLLRGILNDFPDREASAILARCAEAAPPGGRVVVLKDVKPDGVRRPVTIEMVLCGGRHRTLTEFRELARASGLEVVAAGRQPGYYVVECALLVT